MHFTSLFVAALAGVAQAVNVQVVSVGVNPASNKTGLKFWPEKITAEPGTMVQFQFWAGNHTVTQSTFDDPCLPISSINSSIQGIYSGFQPVEASKAMGMIPVFSIMVNDTKPLWLYCSKGKHCQGGMSLVINENTSKNATRSLENYKKLAESSTATEVIPGSGSPAGGNGGSNNGGGSGSGNGNGNGSGSGNGSGNGSTTIAKPPTPTTIQTSVPAGTNGGNKPTATGGESSTTPSNTPVPAAASNLSTSGALLIALGVAVFFF